MKLARLNDKPEIFYTIQGEGRSLGKPSIFLRLSLCNLHCIWCDTDYTWNWAGTSFKHIYDKDPGYSKYHKKDWVIDITPEEIGKILGRFPCQNIVITGGEPLLQQKELITLCHALKHQNDDYWIEIETNGTIVPDSELDHWIDQYNVSPKLKNSGNPGSLRNKPKALSYFSGSTKAYFKYVIDGPADLDEVLEIIDQYHIKKDRIFLMPQGVSPETLAEKRIWLVEICKEHGFNYTDRLHVHIWGNKRGV